MPFKDSILSCVIVLMLLFSSSFLNLGNNDQFKTRFFFVGLFLGF